MLFCSDPSASAQRFDAGKRLAALRIAPVQAQWLTREIQADDAINLAVEGQFAAVQCLCAGAAAEQSGEQDEGE